jgi:hypothetical protein
MTTLGYLFLAIFSIFGAIGGFGSLESYYFLYNTFQVTEHPQVVSPKPGDVLVGKVNITGSTDVLDFKSAEVSFRYEGDTGDNRTAEVVIPNLRVRNYSAVETATPGLPANLTEQPTEITPTSTVAVYSTPTSLPDNPAQVTSVKLALSLVQGAVFAVACFVLLGIYLGLRAFRRRG